MDQTKIKRIVKNKLLSKLSSKITQKKRQIGIMDQTKIKRIVKNKLLSKLPSKISPKEKVNRKNGQNKKGLSIKYSCPQDTRCCLTPVH
jgi:hypothetical protein